MDSIAVIKPDMTVAGQGSLSPFGMLSQLFTQELVRRNGQAIGSYRPLRLAYLEQDKQDEARMSAPKINLDLDVNLLVNRLLREEKKEPKQEEKKTPEQRILERVILRERELRTMVQDTRRVVIESGGRRVIASLPLRASAAREREKEPAQPLTSAWRGGQNAQRIPPVAIAAKELARRSKQALTLASQTTSVPAAGGWTPKQREAHPGYPMQAKQPEKAETAAGSILLPDVMRRHREAALARREAIPSEAAGLEAMEEEALAWSMEGTDTTPETESMVRAVRRAVQETLRRNESRTAPVQATSASGKELAVHAADPVQSGSAPAEMIHRENERARETKEQPAIPAAEAAQPIGAATEISLEGERAPESTGKIAVPAAETKQPNSSTVEGLVYREGERASETTVQAAVPMAETTQPNNAPTTELIYREGERSPETTAQTAIPAAEMTQPNNAPTTELIYRDGERTPDTSAQIAVPAVETTRHGKALTTELTYRKGKRVPETSAQTAIPVAETTQPNNAPTAELIYREGERAPETMAQTAIPAAETTQPNNAPTTELIYREGERTPDTSAQIAIPTAETTQPNNAPTTELIYREGERAPETMAQTAVPAVETTRHGNAPTTELTYRKGKRVPETSAQTAIPVAETTQQSNAPTTELIYREDESAPETTTQTAAEPNRVTAAPRHSEAMLQPIPQPVNLQFLTKKTPMQIAPLAGQMVRDIRVTAAQAAHPTRQPPARPMTYTRQPTAHTAGQAARSEVSAIPALEEAATQKPAELVFAANPTASENPPPAARPTQRPKQASEAERLPEWARELMEQSGITDTAQQSAVFNGAASRQMNWTAPGAMPAQHQGKPAAEPAELSFKEPRESEQPLYRQQISDAELRRTADKVYRMIEERLRRELRRSGR